jgi:hypothetical protein
LEDVEQDEAAVIGEVLEGFSGEREVCVSELSDAADGVDAVDVRNDAVEGEVG